MAAFSTATSLAELVPEITMGVDFIFMNEGIGRMLATYKDVSGQPGVTVEFPIYTEVVASTTVGETAEPSSHEMDIAMATLTIAKRSVYVGLGDLAKKGMSDSPETIGQAMGMSMVKAIDNRIFGVITTTNYATSAGSTNAAMNITYVLNALNVLEKNEVSAPLHIVLHPHQYNAIRAALTPVAATTDTTTIKIGNVISDELMSRGMASNMFGLNWFVTSRISSRTVNATANCYSGLVFNPRGLGYAFSWLYQNGVEMIRGTEAVSKLLLNWADSAGVIYSSGVCTLYSTSS